MPATPTIPAAIPPTNTPVLTPPDDDAAPAEEEGFGATELEGVEAPPMGATDRPSALLPGTTEEGKAGVVVAAVAGNVGVGVATNGTDEVLLVKEVVLLVDGGEAEELVGDCDEDSVLVLLVAEFGGGAEAGVFVPVEEDTAKGLVDGGGMIGKGSSGPITTRKSVQTSFENTS